MTYQNDHLNESTPPAASNDGSTANSNRNSKQRGKKSDYQLTQDPLFYGMVAFFAFLTTGLPGVLGQSTFLLLTQTLGITIFAGIALRRGEVGAALKIMALWMVVQVGVILFLTWLTPNQIERVVRDGFTYRVALLEWFYAGAPLPGGFLYGPGSGMVEILGVLAGSFVSGGLVGNWFLVRAVNHYAFGLSSLMGVENPGLGFLAGLAPWRLLLISGYAGVIVLLAQPIITNRWSPAHYLSTQRRLILTSALLLVLGIALSFVLPGVWQAIFGQ